jgi:hypothetical protein
VVGEHEIVTAEMAELLEPELQAAIPRITDKARIRARARKPSPRS